MGINLKEHGWDNVAESAASDAHPTHTPVPTDFPPISHPFPTPAPGNGGVTDCQKVNSYPLPRTFNGEKYYGADDLAKIIGVSKKTVWQWQQKGYFTADERAHDGRYLYLVERVIQLKSVYRSDWNQPAYLAHVEEPTPTVTDVVEEPMPSVTGVVDENLTQSESQPLNRDKQSRIAEAKKFFDTIFGNVQGDFYSYLWTLENHYTIPFKVSTEKARVAMAERAIKLSDAGKTVFFGVNCGSEALKSNERYKANVPKNQKPDAPSIKLVTLQTVTITDVDIEGGTHKSDAKKAYAPNFDTAKSFLPFPASIVVHSGYGLHAYCIYSEPIAVTDDNRKAVNKRNVDYIAAVRLRSGDCSKTADGVGDVSRVLRVPGTFNYKLGVTPDAPLCHVVEWNDVQFTAKEMDQKLDEFFSQNSLTKQTPAPPLEIDFEPVPDPQQNNFCDFPADGPTEQERALAMLPYVDGSTYDTWYKVGFILKKIGCSFNDWVNWSSTQPKYDPDKPGYNLEYMWNHFPEDNALNINTLHMWAQEGGYSEKDFQREWYAANRPNQPRSKNNKAKSESHATGNKTIDQWQKNNGVINPDLLVAMKDFADRINTLDKITATVANDISVQKMLGAFRYYSPFAVTEQKFFIRLRDAKAVAKAKISAWKKDNTQPEPTDEDKALAALDIKAVERKVETQFTQAKKIHAQYVDYTRRKEVDDKREAEHAAYIQNRPTTKGEVEDCPVDLVLPEDVVFNDEGIKIRDLDNQRVKEDPPIIDTCQNLIVPTKIFRETTTHMTKYEVAIQTGKTWRYKIFDGRTLQDTRSVSELGNYGAHITDARMMAKYFSKIIALNEQNGQLREITSFTKPGWQDDDFTTFIYPPDGDDYHVERNNVDYASIFSVSGDADKWLEMFKDVTDIDKKIGDKKNSESRYVRFAIGACLAAPLLKPLGMKNIQINFWGQSNFAKTPLPKVGLSIFGNPSEGRMMRTWGGSAKNRLTMAAAFCDFPQLLDEGETMSRNAREAQSEAIYDFASGIINQANKRNGDVRAAESFRSVRFSTAEKPMLSINDKKGAYKRVIDVHISYKVFPDSKARDLHLFVERNYGHFGRQWVKYIVENHEAILADFNMLCKYFEEAGFNNKLYAYKFTEIDATNARSVITCAVAFYHFLVCIKLNDSFNLPLTIKLAEEFMLELPTVKEMSDVQRSKDMLASWVAANPRRFVSKSNRVADCIAPIAGKKFNNGSIGFLQSEFRKIIEEDLKLPSYEKFLADLFDEHALDCKDSREKTKQKRLGNERPKMYVIKPGVLVEKDDTPDFDDSDDDDE